MRLSNSTFDLELKIIDMLRNVPYSSISYISEALGLDYYKTYRLIYKMLKENIILKTNEGLILQPIFYEDMEQAMDVADKIMDYTIVEEGREDETLINVSHLYILYSIVNKIADLLNGGENGKEEEKEE